MLGHPALHEDGSRGIKQPVCGLFDRFVKAVAVIKQLEFIGIACKRPQLLAETFAFGIYRRVSVVQCLYRHRGAGHGFVKLDTGEAETRKLSCDAAFIGFEIRYRNVVT